MQFDMKVASRDRVGKGVARTLRREGKIPGILYGQKECLALTLEPTEVRRILHSESGSNSVLNLKISSDKGETKRTAMLRGYQIDPISGAILHADLFEVAMDKSVRVHVPVTVTEGTPLGVAEGGVLQHNLRELHIECLPGQIPASIVVDASSLRVNQGIHVKEVPIPSGIRILDDPDMMVVSIVAPISEAKLEAYSKRARRRKRRPLPRAKPARNLQRLVWRQKPRKRRKKERSLKGKSRKRRKRSSVAGHRRSRQSRPRLRPDTTQRRLLHRRGVSGRSPFKFPPTRALAPRAGFSCRTGTHLSETPNLHEPERTGGGRPTFGSRTRSRRSRRFTPHP